MTTSLEAALRAADERTTKQRESLVARTETAIRGFKRGGRVSVSTNDADSDVVNEVMATYRAVGWHCETYRDIRNETSFVLSEPE